MPDTRAREDEAPATAPWPSAAVRILALGLTSALWLRVAKLVPGGPGFGRPADHHIYLFMATGGAFGLHIAPWCWRVLVPVLAGACRRPPSSGSS